MAKNIEIKAHAENFMHQKELALALATAPLETLVQEDTFFKVPKGRLKLREFPTGQSQLIFYNRIDSEGPKLSEYQITCIDDSEGLKNTLSMAYGIRHVVSKTRHLIMLGRTRVHFDEVASLGEFIELEVVLTDDDDLEAGQAEANGLMERLEIKPEHLVDVAYVDLLEKI